MTSLFDSGSIRRLYWLTAAIGVTGFFGAWPSLGIKTAGAFCLGAMASLGNLYLFNHLTRAISPSIGEPKKPWETRAFITRYLLLFAGGYVIVKTLSVNPLAVILGLLSSTAAVVVSILLELFQALFAKSTTH